MESVYRVSIHNQIYSTEYFIVRKYVKGKTGFIPTSDVCGRRGKGGHLGLSFSQAVDIAKEFNKEVGWTINPKTNTVNEADTMPKFKVWC